MMRHILNIGIFLAALLLASLAPAEDLPIAWSELSPSAGVAGYLVYVGQGSRDYARREDAGDATRHTITGLSETATHYIAVTAYSSSGNESGYSPELVVDHMPPVIVCDVASASVSYSPWRMTVPDVRGLLTITDDVSDLAAITVTQVPAPGSVVVSNGVVTITATDEAGNVTSVVLPYRVSARFEVTVGGLRVIRDGE